ncbi:MAG TPA: hypothetical protein VGR29_06230 [Thermomicrobiales bacterium]|nr:hypothetical protein [Thermomicrobiales bacterium]
MSQQTTKFLLDEDRILKTGYNEDQTYIYGTGAALAGVPMRDTFMVTMETGGP